MSAGLNIAQLDAVNHLGGPCLVLAGAGSGKTRVITHKIGRLIQAGLAANRIAAITFTNKAAAEMRERARQLVGKAAKDVLICTFHSLGVRLLREDGKALGLKSPTPDQNWLSMDDLENLLALADLEVEDVFEEGLHEFLGRFVREVSALAATITTTYLSGEAR